MASEAARLLQAAVDGDRRALARLLTSIEGDDPGVRAILPRIFSASRGAHLVGVTGPPGAGKS
ncbi:MAG: methylmalonyl Co-A mutase-associated GTPase MeaB, partial [Candidatus Limnocylindria bacterium]